MLMDGKKKSLTTYFLLLIPGHNSVVFMIERQVDFIINVITNNIEQGHSAIEVQLIFFMGFK